MVMTSTEWPHAANVFASSAAARAETPGRGGKCALTIKMRIGEASRPVGRLAPEISSPGATTLRGGATESYTEVGTGQAQRHDPDCVANRRTRHKSSRPKPGGPGHSAQCHGSVQSDEPKELSPLGHRSIALKYLRNDDIGP